MLGLLPCLTHPWLTVNCLCFCGQWWVVWEYSCFCKDGTSLSDISLQVNLKSFRVVRCWFGFFVCLFVCFKEKEKKRGKEKVFKGVCLVSLENNIRGWTDWETWVWRRLSVLFYCISLFFLGVCLHPFLVQDCGQCQCCPKMFLCLLVLLPLQTPLSL